MSAVTSFPSLQASAKTSATAEQHTLSDDPELASLDLQKVAENSHAQAGLQPFVRSNRSRLCHAQNSQQAGARHAHEDQTLLNRLLYGSKKLQMGNSTELTLHSEQEAPLCPAQ